VTGRRGAWTIDGIARTFPVDAAATLTRRLTATGTYAWRLAVRRADGVLLYSGASPKSVRVRAAAGAGTRFQVGFKASTSDIYRGVIRLLPRTNGTVAAINEVGLDLYLRGVVPVEMPSSWPAEALNVQAVAARSYAVRHLRPGIGTFDLYDDTRSQVYRGVRAERVPTNAAIAATAGQLLMSGTVVASTVFHSAAGGATENNENVWTSSTGVPGTPVAYLRGAPDRAPEGTAYDAASPYATWATATYSGDALSAIFAADPRTNVGTITALDLTNRGVSGRLISVTLTGTSGVKKVSGEVFRSVFNKYSPLTDPALRSTLFDIAPIP
jgi:stage II sporulation protein D